MNQNDIMNKMQITDFFYKVCFLLPDGRATERRIRSELWLHVQTADHRQQQCGKDLISLPLRWRLLHVSVCEYGGHRFQSQNRLQERQEGQTADLGELAYIRRTADFITPAVCGHSHIHACSYICCFKEMFFFLWNNETN